MSGRTPFDEFRDALAGATAVPPARYPISAQRGKEDFHRQRRLNNCLFGPTSPMARFHDTGNSQFVAKRAGVDAGRP